MQRVPPETKQNARTLRKHQTDAEQRLWRSLRKRQLNGYRFRRQHPIGKYIVDFVSLDTKVIIELDGSQHQEQQHYDTQRDEWLHSQGYSVLRFWNNQVMNEFDGVLEEILNVLPPSQSSPCKGEEALKLPPPLRGRAGEGV